MHASTLVRISRAGAAAASGSLYNRQCRRELSWFLRSFSPFHNPALVGGLTKAAQKNAPRDDVREQAFRGRISAPQGTARALLRKNVRSTHESTTLLVHPSKRLTFTNLSVGRGSSSTQRRLRSRPRTAAPPSLLIVLLFKLKTRKHELLRTV